MEFFSDSKPNLVASSTRESINKYFLKDNKPIDTVDGVDEFKAGARKFYDIHIRPRRFFIYMLIILGVALYIRYSVEEEEEEFDDIDEFLESDIKKEKIKEKKENIKPLHSVKSDHKDSQNDRYRDELSDRYSGHQPYPEVAYPGCTNCSTHQPSFNPHYSINSPQNPNYVKYPPSNLSLHDQGQVVFTDQFIHPVAPQEPIRTAPSMGLNMANVPDLSYHQTPVSFHPQPSSIINPYNYSNDFNTHTANFANQMSEQNNVDIASYYNMINNNSDDLENMALGPAYLDEYTPEKIIPPYA